MRFTFSFTATLLSVNYTQLLVCLSEVKQLMSIISCCSNKTLVPEAWPKQYNCLAVNWGVYAGQNSHDRHDFKVILLTINILICCSLLYMMWEYSQKRRRGRWLPGWPGKPAPPQGVSLCRCDPWWVWKSQTPPRWGTWSGHTATPGPTGRARCTSLMLLQKDGEVTVWQIKPSQPRVRPPGWSLLAAPQLWERVQ